MKVGIVMGSDSDLGIMKNAADVLRNSALTMKWYCIRSSYAGKKLEICNTFGSEKGSIAFIAGRRRCRVTLPGVTRQFHRIAGNRRTA